MKVTISQVLHNNLFVTSTLTDSLSALIPAMPAMSKRGSLTHAENPLMQPAKNRSVYSHASARWPIKRYLYIKICKGIIWNMICTFFLQNVARWGWTWQFHVILADWLHIILNLVLIYDHIFVILLITFLLFYCLV